MKKLDPAAVPQAFVTERDHLIFCSTLAQAAALDVERPTFVEIGTHKGQGATAVMTALNSLKIVSRFVTFDIAWNRWKRKQWYAREMWGARCERLARQGPCLGEFHERPGVEGVALVDEAVWLFVDGCHCRECVEAETAAWAPKIKSGGFILYHDADERYAARPADQRFHGDARRVGVLEAIEGSDVLRDEFVVVAEAPARTKPFLFGGIRAYRRLA